jgi:hypothetical protein
LVSFCDLRRLGSVAAEELAVGVALLESAMDLRLRPGLAFGGGNSGLPPTSL